MIKVQTVLMIATILSGLLFTGVVLTTPYTVPHTPVHYTGSVTTVLPNTIESVGSPPTPSPSPTPISTTYNNTG